jgi:hypothetical protein
MARTKLTKRKEITPTNIIKCPDCETTVTTTANLKRHRTLKHTTERKRIICTLCHRSFCRKDVAKRHFNNSHPDHIFNAESTYQIMEPRKLATKPKPWIPPFEARPRLTATPRFVTKPGNNSPYNTATISELHEDLYLSDNSISSTDTECLDELPPHLQDREIHIYSVFGSF